jgi:succinyldiaminopimelate transaminase
MSPAGFDPPVYPYERLAPAKAAAEKLPGGLVDLSIGTPCDPPPDEVVAALSSSGAERGYPMSVGSARYREAAAGWMARRLGVELDPAHVYSCVGTKEFVATLPQWLRLRTPDKDTVLYPEVSYPTYEMGAILAGCRPVPYRSLEEVDEADARRALCVWVNSPANPSGEVHDLAAAAAWGRERGVPVFSDECYIEFTWAGERRTILSSGLDGVVALHSVSKRSNLAGLRAGFYAGDPALVRYLGEVRKHVGMLVPGPVQAAAAVSLDDDAHVDEQRARYLERLERFREVLAKLDVFVPLPQGGFYLWAAVDDAWAFTDRLAREGGALVSPGEFYGPAGAGHVRVALVQPMDRLEVVAERLGVA